jgi:polo-like kinase 4
MKGETPTVDDYDIGQLLGRGGFASVYRARERRTGLLYAMKIMDKAHIKKHNMEIRVQNEIKIQSELKFQGIVQLRCHFEDSEYVYMILELCEGGNLYRYLKTNGPLNEAGAAAVIKQLLLALEYMHGLNVVHRDLKLSNVLLVKNPGDTTVSNASLLQCHVKLCDFGLAVQVEHPDEVKRLKIDALITSCIKYTDSDSTSRDKPH